MHFDGHMHLFVVGFEDKTIFSFNESADEGLARARDDGRYFPCCPRRHPSDRVAVHAGRRDAHDVAMESVESRFCRNEEVLASVAVFRGSACLRQCFGWDTKKADALSGQRNWPLKSGVAHVWP